MLILVREIIKLIHLPSKENVLTKFWEVTYNENPQRMCRKNEKLCTKLLAEFRITNDREEIGNFTLFGRVCILPIN